MEPQNEKTQLPSRFQIGDSVAVNLFNAGKFGAAKVKDVRFSEGKVKYDLRVCVERENERSEDSPALYTRLYGIDSDFVVSRQEWLDHNQSRPEYGMNIPETKTLLTEIKDAFGWLAQNRSNGYDPVFYKKLIERIDQQISVVK